MKKKILFISIGIIALVVAAFFIFKKKPQEKEIYAEVKKGELEVIVTTTGELKAKNQTDINIPMELRGLQIWQIKVTDLIPEGTVVKEGDYVASLDKTEIMTKMNESNLNVQKWQSELKQAMLDTTLTLRSARDEMLNQKYLVEQKKLEKEQSKFEAPAILRNAEIEYEKAQRNYEQQLENYKTKVAQAKTKVAIIQADLSKAQNQLDGFMNVMNQLNIVAPQGGMLIYAKSWDGKKIVVGSSVSPWDPAVATLPDLTVMEVVTYVSEIDIQKIKPDQEVEIGLDSDPSKKLKGKISTVASIGEQKPNSDAKVFEVLINVLTPDTTLKPSMTTSCKILCAKLKDVTYAPIEAVQRAGSAYFVYVKEGGKIYKQEVRTGVSNETDIVITEGVDEKTTLLLSTPKDTVKMEYKTLPPLQPVTKTTTPTKTTK
jgi:multidrug efflux pump subunit AcrA (membrane-fusion protein)